MKYLDTSDQYYTMVEKNDCRDSLGTEHLYFNCNVVQNYTAVDACETILILQVLKNEYMDVLTSRCSCCYRTPI